MVDGKVGQDSARPLDVTKKYSLSEAYCPQTYFSTTVVTVPVDARGLEDLGLNQLTPQSL